MAGFFKLHVQILLKNKRGTKHIFTGKVNNYIEKQNKEASDLYYLPYGVAISADVHSTANGAIVRELGTGDDVEVQRVEIHLSRGDRTLVDLGGLSIRDGGGGVGEGKEGDGSSFPTL